MWHHPGQIPQAPPVSVGQSPIQHTPLIHSSPMRSPLESQRQQLGTTLAKQRALASALRVGAGGTPEGAPALHIQRPMGIPQIK